VAVLLSFLLLTAAYFSHVSNLSYRTIPRTRTSKENHSSPEVHQPNVTVSAARTAHPDVNAIADVTTDSPPERVPVRVASSSGAIIAVSTALPTQSVATLPDGQLLRQGSPESLRFNSTTTLSAPPSVRTASIALQGIPNDTSSTTCKDALCTEYLTEKEWQMFSECTNRVSTHGKLLKNGSCRFMNGTARSEVALASFPGSGSTWVRGLLETATGICTGRVCTFCEGVYTAGCECSECICAHKDTCTCIENTVTYACKDTCMYM